MEPDKWAGPASREPCRIGEEDYCGYRPRRETHEGEAGMLAKLLRPPPCGVHHDKSHSEHHAEQHDDEHLGPQEELDRHEEGEEHASGDRSASLSDQELVQADDDERWDWAEGEVQMRIVQARQYHR